MQKMTVASSWIYLTIAVVIAVVALGVVAITTPIEQANKLGEPVIDYASLIDNLHSTGAIVEPSGEVSQPFFSVKGQVIKVNGDDVQVFEYADSTAADSEAELVSPDGSSIGTSMVHWVATPHFYNTDKLIVLYVGDKTAVVDALEAVLGPQFAGR